MSGRLTFGTAGIRGPLGEGDDHMNRRVVHHVVTGTVRHLLDRVGDARTRGVVVGRDARHGSDELEAEVVEVLVTHGVRVLRYADPVPTPLVAHTLAERRAAAALVVTASHNPATDNGLKVYWDDGAQIAPPLDAEIARLVDASFDGMLPPAPNAGPRRVEHLEDVEPYVRDALGLVAGSAAPPSRVAWTALHGVGGDLLEQVLRRAGHTDLHAVGSQRHPDPDFPTAPVPNPEEAGVLDALVDLATSVDADVGLALDPDADRLAVVAPDRIGGWRTLTGDETGALLLSHLLERTDGVPDRFAATTIVSSRLAAAMCRGRGVEHVETPTGFKWLCRHGLAHPELHQVLLYEEALGYAVGPTARDKDGITAALVLLDALGTWRATRRSALDVLDELAVEHGAHVTLNGSLRVARDVVDRLVRRPPSSLGGSAVHRVDTTVPGVLRLWTDDATRVVVRPSGTEPKVKYYCEAVEPVPTPSALADARASASRRAAAAVDELLAELRG